MTEPSEVQNHMTDLRRQLYPDSRGLLIVCNNSIEYKHDNMGKTATNSAETHLPYDREINHIMCVVYSIYI